jgi:hypothetical protein
VVRGSPILDLYIFTFQLLCIQITFTNIFVLLLSQSEAMNEMVGAVTCLQNLRRLVINTGQVQMFTFFEFLTSSMMFQRLTHIRVELDNTWIDRKTFERGIESMAHSRTLQHLDFVSPGIICNVDLVRIATGTSRLKSISPTESLVQEVNNKHLTSICP